MNPINIPQDLVAQWKESHPTAVPIPELPREFVRAAYRIGLPLYEFDGELMPQYNANGERCI